MGKTIRSIRFRVSLKTDGGFYPAGSVLYAPFPEDVLAEIAAENTIEVVWDSAVGNGGAPADESLPSENVEVADEEPVVDEKAQLEAEKSRLEAYVSMLGLTFDRRKSVKRLRKEISQQVVRKAKEYGQVLETSADLDVLMKEFADLKALEEDI